MSNTLCFTELNSSINTEELSQVEILSLIESLGTHAESRSENGTFFLNATKEERDLMLKLKSHLPSHSELVVKARTKARSESLSNRDRYEKRAGLSLTNRPALGSYHNLRSPAGF